MSYYYIDTLTRNRINRFSQIFGTPDGILKGAIDGLLLTRVELTGLAETVTGFSGLIGVLSEILSKYLFVFD